MNYFFFFLKIKDQKLLEFAKGTRKSQKHSALSSLNHKGTEELNHIKRIFNRNLWSFGLYLNDAVDKWAAAVDGIYTGSGFCQMYDIKQQRIMGTAGRGHNKAIEFWS